MLHQAIDYVRIIFRKGFYGARFRSLKNQERFVGRLRERASEHEFSASVG
jgi:hypothetical protein